MNGSKLSDIVKRNMKRVLFRGKYSTIYCENIVRNNANKRSVREHLTVTKGLRVLETLNRACETITICHKKSPYTLANYVTCT